jgi:putative salt-induced outer membrane protein
MYRPLLLLGIAPLLLANADPLAIPPQIRAMLEAAFDSGNEGEAATIVKYAISAAPDDAAAIRGLSDAWLARRREERQTVIERAGMFDLWKGRAELGGWLTTGNSPDTGLSATIDLAREGPRWRQKFRFQLDYQDSLGVATHRHYLASYEPNLKVSDRAYLYGAAQYESDRFAGYYNRYSGSVGAGISAIRNDRMKLNLELGPAYRDTSYTDTARESSIAARGTLDFNWKLSPGLSVTQTASAYLQHYSSTLAGTTALNAKLIGPLSARLSYNIQHETLPAAGRVPTDTTSRAALVYSF